MDRKELIDFWDTYVDSVEVDREEARFSNPYGFTWNARPGKPNFQGFIEWLRSNF